MEVIMRYDSVDMRNQMKDYYLTVHDRGAVKEL